MAAARQGGGNGENGRGRPAALDAWGLGRGPRRLSGRLGRGLGRPSNAGIRPTTCHGRAPAAA
eukprot:3962968-Lingulodinium_polyedra.AAC.1